MSVRSFALEITALVAVATVPACSSKSKPEADPAKVQQLTKTMADNAPPLAGMRECGVADYQQPQMTLRTVLQLAQAQMDDTPERAEWINPRAVDAPAARTLLESKDETARRQAAAELLAAKAYIVYRVDMVNVPLALEIKELKRGAVGIRAIGYGRDGLPVCVKQLTVQNDKAKSEWAMQTSNKALVDPAVAKALRDDLEVQLLARIEKLKAGT